MSLSSVAISRDGALKNSNFRHKLCGIEKTSARLQCRGSWPMEIATSFVDDVQVSGVIAVSLRRDRVCALLDTDAVSCWTISHNAPTFLTGWGRIQASLMVLQLEQSDQLDCVRFVDLTIECKWRFLADLAPPNFDALKGKYSFVDMACSSNAVCGITNDGHVHCVQSAGAPETIEIVKNVPKVASLPSDHAKSIIMGYDIDIACMMTNFGEVQCWGVDSGLSFSKHFRSDQLVNHIYGGSTQYPPCARLAHGSKKVTSRAEITQIVK
jgi:hypothetical protein